jgi:hypothetical protein
MTSRRTVLRRNTSDIMSRENQFNTHVMCNNVIYFFEYPKPYGACALHAWYLRLQTHSEYVILVAFPLQQWLHKRPSVFRYTYMACIVEI